jgi:hypothetical protein
MRSGEGKRRLKSIEGSLEAQQIMLLWLDEARRHATLHDLVRSLKGLPEGAYPLYRLTAQAERPDRLRYLAGESQKIRGAVRDTVRDVGAAYFLFVDLNAGVMAEGRTMWLSLLGLSHALTPWTHGELPRTAPPIASQVRAYLRDLVLWTEVVETISERRFQGYDVLLPGHRQELDDLKEQAEHLLVRFGDHLDHLVWQKQESGTRTPKLPKPITWETLCAQVADDVAAQVSLLVDVARAEACEMMGERQRALWFAERHL